MQKSPTTDLITSSFPPHSSLPTYSIVKTTKLLKQTKPHDENKDYNECFSTTEGKTKTTTDDTD